MRFSGRLGVWKRATRHALTLVGVAVLFLLLIASRGDHIHTYWAINGADPYRGTLGQPAAFLYSPVAALAALPLHLLPFETVRLLWIGLDVACLVYLAGPWALALVAIYPVTQEISFGNIQLLMAAAIVLGFRYPIAWSFLLLTKVTPGIGLLWFALRREWRPLAIACGTTVVLVAASMLVTPSWWPAWIATLLSSAGGGEPGTELLPIPLTIRLPLAAAVTAWGAMTDRPWAVPIAAALAVPAIWWATPCMLIAVAPLVRTRAVVPRGIAQAGVPVTTAADR